MEEYSDVDILRISLIDDDDFTILNSLINKPIEKDVGNDFKISLEKKIKNSKKNVSKIHKKIPDAEITNIRSQYKQDRDGFEEDFSE